MTQRVIPMNSVRHLASGGVSGNRRARSATAGLRLFCFSPPRAPPSFPPRLPPPPQTASVRFSFGTNQRFPSLLAIPAMAGTSASPTRYWAQRRPPPIASLLNANHLAYPICKPSPLDMLSTINGHYKLNFNEGDCAVKYFGGCLHVAMQSFVPIRAIRCAKQVRCISLVERNQSW